jgi:acetyl-CoA carboxylase biotin carboxyl carrier protein
MKAKEIQELIDFISKSGLDEVNIETEEFKIKVKKNSEPKYRTEEIYIPQAVAAPAPVSLPVASAPASAPAPSPASASSAAPEESKYLTIKSPMIGTFYRTPNPDSEPFVKIGDRVKAGQAVCIIEAMKLFNEIESEISGTIVKVLVENATPVEYDQPLFLVDPS